MEVGQVKKILNIQEMGNSKWPGAIAQTFGDNLVSAFLFGDCLEEGFSALDNPWTVGIILKDASPDEVEKLSSLGPAALRENLAFSHLWSGAEILNSLEEFPLEYLEISSRSVPLCGIAPLEGFAPKKDALAKQCLREWKGFLFHKRACLAECPSEKAKTQAAGTALRELTPLLNGIFYAAFGKYPESRRQVLEAFPQLGTPENPQPLTAMLRAVQELMDKTFAGSLTSAAANSATSAAPALTP